MFFGDKRLEALVPDIISFIFISLTIFIFLYYFVQALVPEVSFNSTVSILKLVEKKGIWGEACSGTHFTSDNACNWGCDNSVFLRNSCLLLDSRPKASLDRELLGGK